LRHLKHKLRKLLKQFVRFQIGLFHFPVSFRCS
jgi:hypothetical protein